MRLTYLLAGIGGGLLIAGIEVYALSRRLEKHEPYRSFTRLRIRQKLTFFRRLLSDRRIPWLVKMTPIILVLYLAMPIDLIPDFVPVLGYLDDVAVALIALALVVRFSPRPILNDLLRHIQVTVLVTPGTGRILDRKIPVISSGVPASSSTMMS